MSLLGFTCFSLLFEEDGCSGPGAFCSDVSLENIGQGFVDRNNGETSVGLQFALNLSGSGRAGKIGELLTGAVRTATSGGLGGPTLLLSTSGRVMTG